MTTRKPYWCDSGKELHNSRNNHLLISYFSIRNPYIKDTLQRLAEDGSQKLVTTMRECAVANAKEGRSVKCFAFVVATWIRYLVGFDEQGEVIIITDPRSEELTLLAREILGSPNGLLSEVTAPSEPPVKFLHAVFGEELASNPVIVKAVHDTLVNLVETSTHELMTKLCSTPVP